MTAIPLQTGVFEMTKSTYIGYADATMLLMYREEVYIFVLIKMTSTAIVRPLGSGRLFMKVPSSQYDPALRYLGSTNTGNL